MCIYLRVRVCAVVLRHPSCLTLPVWLSPWGQSSPFSEANEIGKNGRDKGEHRVGVCHELFMSSVWCVLSRVFNNVLGVCTCAAVLNEQGCCFKDK